jgi:hypothetical protein
MKALGDSGRVGHVAKFIPQGQIVCFIFRHGQTLPDAGATQEQSRGQTIRRMQAILLAGKEKTRHIAFCAAKRAVMFCRPSGFSDEEIAIAHRSEALPQKASSWIVP